MLSTIPERDVCLFHGDDNDQSARQCPSPLIDRGSGDSGRFDGVAVPRVV